MKVDDINDLFNELNGHFDSEVPGKGHRDRFLKKLNDRDQVVTLPGSKRRNWWKPISIAASFLLIVSIGIGVAKKSNNTEPLVSTEVEETQLYFTSLIEQEVEKLNAIADNDTQVIIDDVMLQLQKLETNYEELKTMFLENGYDKQILYAMITNFQTRINLLQDVMYRIEEIKQQQENNNNENNII